MVAHREGTGEAEYHATQADILVVQTGSASIIIGGELIDGKTTALNEMRAPSIKGGGWPSGMSSRFRRGWRIR